MLRKIMVLVATTMWCKVLGLLATFVAVMLLGLSQGWDKNLHQLVVVYTALPWLIGICGSNWWGKK